MTSVSVARGTPAMRKASRGDRGRLVSVMKGSDAHSFWRRLQRIRLSLRKGDDDPSPKLPGMPERKEFPWPR
jgi:hypothetical protein